MTPKKHQRRYGDGHAVVSPHAPASHRQTALNRRRHPGEHRQSRKPVPVLTRKTHGDMEEC